MLVIYHLAPEAQAIANVHSHAATQSANSAIDVTVDSVPDSRLQRSREFSKSFGRLTCRRGGA